MALPVVHRVEDLKASATAVKKKWTDKALMQFETAGSFMQFKNVSRVA